MTQVTAKMVKSLRDRTGAGMMDCKNALVESDGDEEKAIEEIQKKGLAKVAKKAGAITAEGLVHAYIHGGGRVGVLVEVNCQTDFVARNDEFKQFVDELAMHIASERPEYVSDAEIPGGVITKQKEIFLGQLAEEAKASGKERPAAAIEKIVEGKLNKWKKGVCLLDQLFIMAEGKETIASIVDRLTAKIGEKISIRRFVRYERGEGIEKKVEDLAEAVAATIAEA
ncbi:MAG: translation elongation factor Ts [Deltaproteobacteria bacterium]|nr:translation elongation factor Ts [Deltaproteobacteria bacterium]